MGASPEEVTSDSLELAFPRALLPTLLPKAGWAADHPLRRRYEVLTASGPYPSDPHLRWKVMALRAEKAALEAYLDAARATDVLDDEVLGRLRGSDADGYRSAVAECMACWFFAAKLGMRVGSKPDGRRGRRLDLSAVSELTGDELHVEVKAPSVEIPPNRHWSGNDSAVLVQCLRAANDQFDEGRANVLVVAPQFRTPIFIERDQLVEAFIGQPVAVVAVALGDEPAPEPEVVFRPDGHLVRPGKTTPAGREPRFTRVSAVVTIEDVLAEKQHASKFTPEQIHETSDRGDNRIIAEVFWEHLARRRRDDHAAWVEHRAFVVHNPFAKTPIDEAVFQSLPQLVRRGSEMRWTDGYTEE